LQHAVKGPLQASKKLILIGRIHLRTHPDNAP
jgi:hypothetical protein